MTPLEVIREEVGPVDEASALDSLNLDSLELVDLLLKIENACGRKIEFDSIPQMQSVGDLCRAASGN